MSRILPPKAAKWIAVAGSAIALVCFFLPWADFAVFSAAGCQIPGKLSALASSADKSGGSSGWAALSDLLFLIPVLAAAAIGSQLAGLRRKNAVAVAGALVLFGMVFLLLLAIVLGDPSEGHRFIRRIFTFLSPGFYGTLLGGAGMLLGGVAGGGRQPGHPGNPG